VAAEVRFCVGLASILHEIAGKKESGSQASGWIPRSIFPIGN